MIRKKRVRCNSGEKGSIGDLLSTGLCILAMLAVMMQFLDCMSMVNRKTEISQLARNYILRMETKGFLTLSDREELVRDLLERGITEVDLQGTTIQKASYGEEIRLCISGMIEGNYAFEEIRVSTAKN